MNALAQARPQGDSSEKTMPPACSESQRMETIGRLVSGVAHDFNNLLTGIVLCSDLILAGLEQRSPLRRYAREIRSAGSHGADLVQQLLAVAREEDGAPRRLQVNDVVLETRDLLMRLIGENIELVTTLDRDLETVSLNRAQARQIILNLVLNARDAMPSGGRITLVTRSVAEAAASNEGGQHPQSAIELEVSDDGCGMNADTRSRVFEPFFTTKGAEGGTGLGLSTVQGIVVQHGGTIRITSTPGKGTSVVVRLPKDLASGPQSASGLKATSVVEVVERGEHS